VPAAAASAAAVNVLRTPGRAAVGAVSLAVGVTALTVLAAVTLAFRGVVVGTLLGNAVAVQVRGVDYVAVIATSPSASSPSPTWSSSTSANAPPN
jgi:putative ABC transport system permease protein